MENPIELKPMDRRAKFAIQCREVRLYLADHPGLTEEELKEHFGYDVESHLTRMKELEAVISHTYHRKNRLPKEMWYVNPK